ncbi:MAG TPA: SpoIVB peptidase S55 domain-containing protein [Thermoanaerobaculaceae bacterium]|nr:SpoIVB peptidase S55 domain-containing protein [Thermoanaerobaculaceae bacterium]HPS77410.1 SpoIVB peptidase S55 domain-containing protein [Thermoanaerobaculaceae bacterium]
MLTLALALALTGPVAWIDPHDVKAGQKGVCVTEWTDGRRREIPVEVMGVLDAPAPERTSVLVRLDDPELAGGGVAAGMSGSPVYIDGKLLGAVAYGWAFAREPLAGVTPFSTMRAIGTFAPPASAPPPTLQQLSLLAAGRLDPLAVLPHLDHEGPGAAWPVAVSGLPGAQSGWGSQVLTRAGLGPAGPVGNGPVAGVPEPGEMMAVLLAWGDALVAAGGTVTAREGDTLWAFGHPLFGLGSVRLPAARARVLAVQASYQSPFKVFALGEAFGSLVADRPSGVMARIEPPPAGLPVEVEVREAAGVAHWRFRVAEHPLLSPLMVTYLTNACLMARGTSAGESTVRMTYRARMEDGQSLAMFQAARSADAPARLAAFSGAVTALLAASPLPHPKLTGVEVFLQRDELPAGAVIAEVLPARTVVRPGEELAVEVRLQPYLQPMSSQRLLLRIPAVMPAGDVDLVVADGAAWTDYLLKSQPPNAVTFSQQVGALRQFESSTTLVLALEGREKGVAVPGGVLSAVPPSWAWSLGAGLGGTVTRVPTSIVGSTRWAAPYPLEGAVRIPIVVRPPREAP